MACGFFNDNGEVLYLWIEAEPDVDGRSVFYLKRSFKDPEAVLIQSGSELEIKVIRMLDRAKVPPGQEDHFPDIEILKTVLLNRKLPAFKELSTRQLKLEDLAGVYEARVIRKTSGRRSDFLGEFFSMFGTNPESTIRGDVTIEIKPDSKAMDYRLYGKFLLCRSREGDKARCRVYYVENVDTLEADDLIFRRVK